MNLPKILPDDEDPKSIRHWRLGIGLSSVGAGILSLAIWIAMTVGFPKFGSLAWASEVDAKIKSAVDPILIRLDKLENTTAAQVESSNALLLELTEKSLIEMNRRRCSSTTVAERDYWQAEMNKLKIRYKRYSGGDPYEQRLCADL